jgi:CHAD domain-containing protein
MSSREPSARELVAESLGRGFGRLVTNDPLARSGRSDEGVHQMRVAARRLRAELRVFRSALKRKPTGALREELRWLGGSLGPVRDLDTVEPLLTPSGFEPQAELDSALLRVLDAERAVARAALADCLSSVRYRRLLRTLADALIEPPTRRIAAVPARGVVLPELRHAVRALERGVDELGAAPSEEALHRVRILAKRLRYPAEAAAAFDGPAAEKVGKALAEVQDHLGEARDAARAIALLERSAGIQTLSPEATDELHRRTAALRVAAGAHHDSWREPYSKARALIDQLGWSAPAS